MVLDATGLGEDAMQRFASWTNLSETTFVFPPTVSAADYMLRIFTTDRELPFAGHPTLGTCHAFLAASQQGTSKDELVQECAAGLIHIRRRSRRLGFAAPPLIRYEPVSEPDIAHSLDLLHLSEEVLVDAHWVDNGPGWLALLLRDADAVRRLRPGAVHVPVGLVGPYPPGAEASFEVRAFFPTHGTAFEDPVTGSLNAALAKWLFDTGRVPAGYVVSQGKRSDDADAYTQSATRTAPSGSAATLLPVSRGPSTCDHMIALPHRGHGEALKIGD